MANSVSNVRRHAEQKMNLPCVDEAKLKARLIAKPQLEQNPKALKFSGLTATQRRKVNVLTCYSVVINLILYCYDTGVNIIYCESYKFLLYEQISNVFIFIKGCMHVYL
jgi:hypothetical protein